MPDGEVSVSQQGQETAIGAPTLDGDIHVDLDGEVPQLRIPPRVEVGYWDEDDEDDDVAADGGLANRREIEMRGFGLTEDQAVYSIVIAVCLLVGSGHFGFGTNPIAGITMLAGGILSGYVGVRSYWSDRT